MIASRALFFFAGLALATVAAIVVQRCFGGNKRGDYEAIPNGNGNGNYQNGNGHRENGNGHYA